MNFKLGDVDDPSCSSTMEVFIDPVMQDHHLIIFGFGHVGRALAALAHDHGFRITVADHREGIFDTGEAQHYSTVKASYPDTVEELDYDEETFIVVTTSEHRYDF